MSLVSFWAVCRSNTVYDASYNTGGTPRCLYIKNTSQAARDSRLAPDVEGCVIVLVNDTRCGLLQHNFVPELLSSCVTE